MYRIRISLDGESITLSVFVDAADHFQKLLRHVEKSVTAGSEGVAWKLASLKYGSPVTLEAFGQPRPGASANLPALVGRLVLDGCRLLEAGQGRPRHFNDDALEAAKRLGALRGHGGVSRISVASATSSTARPETVDLSQRVAASVDDLIGDKVASIGSVEGILETITAHGAPHFTVYQSLTGRGVKCDLPEELKTAALDAFEKRVSVHGVVLRDSSGRPRRIKAERLEVFPQEEELPASITGIATDFTGGADTVDFLKKRWR